MSRPYATTRLVKPGTSPIFGRASTCKLAFSLEDSLIDSVRPFSYILGLKLIMICTQVFSVPGVAHIMHFMGAIKGDRDLCQQAMTKGFPLLVFPGGSKEVCRKKGFKRYSLEWGTRSGFARLALKHGESL